MTYNEIGRRLYLPEEILTLPHDMILIFHKNLPVIPARMVKYFAAPEFRNGGTGKRRRLGFAAALLAALTLCLGMLLAGAGVMAAAMPRIGGMPRGGASQSDGPVSWPPAGRNRADRCVTCRPPGSNRGRACGAAGPARAASSSKSSKKPGRSGPAEVGGVCTKGPSPWQPKLKSRTTSRRPGPPPSPPTRRSRDGTIDAFLRQGANELGAALKAFPDSLQVDEPGAVFNPLYSDIAADRREASLPTPADLVESPAAAAQQQDQQQTQGRGISM